MPVKDEPYTHVHFANTRPDRVVLALKAAAYDALAENLADQSSRIGVDEERYRLLARVYRAAADNRASGALEATRAR